MLLLDKKNEFLEKIRNNPDTKYTVYFGTKAAPLTKSHEAIIDYCVEEFLKYPNVHFRIGVADSEWKFVFGLLTMVENYVFSHKKYGITYNGNDWKSRRIDVLDQHCWKGLYTYLKDLDFHGDKTLVIVGEDEWKHLEANDGVWNNAENFVAEYRFHCAKIRDDGISATEVRDIFYKDPDVDYRYVSKFISKWTFDYIKRHGTFWQLYENYRAEENLFIKKYDPTKFKQPSVTVDNIVWHKEESGKTKVLLIRRGGHPYKMYWALPGGFFDVDNDLSIEGAASRELKEETSIEHVYSRDEQFRTYADIGTDPRCRIVDVVFGFEVTNEIEQNSAESADDAIDLAWFDISLLPKMAFNHKQIISEFFGRNS